MKPFIILLTAGLFAISCNSSPSDPKTETKHEEAEHTTEVSTSAKPSLELNNGEKWKADESTNNNVNSLEKIVNDFMPADQKNLEDYKGLHTSLEGAIDKMVKECKMQGADHDALHLWLAPLMGMVKKLGEVTSAGNGANSLKEIDDQIKLFRQYFA